MVAHPLNMAGLLLMEVSSGHILDPYQARHNLFEPALWIDNS
jgi:hypothetical protein